MVAVSGKLFCQRQEFLRLIGQDLRNRVHALVMLRQHIVALSAVHVPVGDKRGKIFIHTAVIAVPVGAEIISG